MGSILYYVLLGLSLAAPMGPINAAVINRGLRDGFSYAWILAIGAMLADIVYILFVYFGLVKFINTPIIQTFLWLFGGFVLLYSGVEGFVKTSTVLTRSKKEQKSIFWSFLSGFMMSFMNPLAIVFWLGIYGSVLVSTVTKYGTSKLIFFTGCILFGVAVWDFSVALLSSFSRNFISEHIIQLISKISAVGLILFGLYFGYHGIQFFF
ncbi:LysE family translocator [Niallia nealsonii]|uniref:Amino acid transporter n=1 Tax=Niallia nealsonii TaxID=115979 RepID=A0A2N0Z2Z3_9BACI|nr:LysE family transporter [Niallia nealsonii]PKG23872.1 amino acid transporter [Niallia nealsonii]